MTSSIKLSASVNYDSFYATVREMIQPCGVTADELFPDNLTLLSLAGVRENYRDEVSGLFYVRQGALRSLERLGASVRSKVFEISVDVGFGHFYLASMSNREFSRNMDMGMSFSHVMGLRERSVVSIIEHSLEQSLGRSIHVNERTVLDFLNQVLPKEENIPYHWMPELYELGQYFRWVPSPEAKGQVVDFIQKKQLQNV